MKMRGLSLGWGLCVVPLLGTQTRGADLDAVLKLMPADFPLGAVVVDFEKLDKNILAYAQAINPRSDFKGMLADIKKEIGIAAWIDFTKPVGFAQASLQGGDPIVWATVPNFKDKVKTVAEAREEEGGVWFLPFAEMDDLYAIEKGGIVIAAEDKTLLESALQREGRTLADDLKPRLDLLTNRDIYVHLNFDPLRPMALGGIMQASQAAPMMAMMMAQQGGMDPATVAAVATALVDAAKKFAEQVAYVDVVLGISPTVAAGTIATGYKDGPIKDYLARNKPASVPLLMSIEEQPFTMAAAWHIPGKESPFIDYFFDKLGTTPGGPAAGGEKSAQADAAKEATSVSRELYRKVEGMNAVMHMSSKGMLTLGDYMGSDPQGILELAGKTMTQPNPLAKTMSSGIQYEATGTKKLGEYSVQQLTLKVDPTNPAAAQAMKMFGESTNMYMAVMDGRVGYFMGPEGEAEKFFTAKVQKPLAKSKLVADALEALPPKRNLIVLFDPAGILPALGPLIGAEMPADIPPGPPIAISVLLSGEYARTDVHVPAKAISRVVDAVSPQPPM